MSELKPCPMCGNKQPQIDCFGVTIRASCYDCGIQTPNYHIDDVDRDYVVDNWNQRVVNETEKHLTTDRNNAIGLMSPSWQHAAGKEPDLMTRYVTMAENQFKKKNEEIELLTEIATKHATVNDERYELLEKQKSDIEKMLDQLFKHEKVDAWLVCKMNDMLDDVNHQLEKSRIDAASISNDD